MFARVRGAFGLSAGYTYVYMYYIVSVIVLGRSRLCLSNMHPAHVLEYL